MKKGYMWLFVSIVILAACAMFSVAATYNCYDGTSDTPCVCGYKPNSLLGYGQVILNGTPQVIISCDNVGDTYCPEDFQDASTGLIGNCSNCPDPDCIATVQGMVKDLAGKPVEKATITGHPIKWVESANLDRNTSTTSNGLYSSDAFITGKYYFSASKDAYDTQLIEATVVRGSTTSLNFSLQNGTCHEDCTNSYNRCNKECDGVTFDNGTKQCKFYDENVKKLCDTKTKGTVVYLGPGTGNAGIFITCCGDGTDESYMPYEKYYSKASVDSNNLKNLVKTEKIAKYNGIPVRIIIAYWKQ
jgi:hypothetical protein